MLRLKLHIFKCQAERQGKKRKRERKRKKNGNRRAVTIEKKQVPYIFQDLTDIAFFTRHVERSYLMKMFPKTTIIPNHHSWSTQEQSRPVPISSLDFRLKTISLFLTLFSIITEIEKREKQQHILIKSVKECVYALSDKAIGRTRPPFVNCLTLYGRRLNQVTQSRWPRRQSREINATRRLS